MGRSSSPWPLACSFFWRFVWHEGRTLSPMMPLGLFRSPTFSGINVLTLFLQSGQDGAFLLHPFDLIQVDGFSATLVGAVFLPFTIIMGVLSRWSGGLLDRVGARVPLIAGPIIAAVGFALFTLSGPSTSYWSGFLAPIAIIGLGMAVTVAPLTTTVINAVPGHQTGVASGINNAVASVATLLAIAIFGALTLNGFGSALDRDLQSQALSSGVRQVIESTRGKFVIDPSLTTPLGADRPLAEAVVKESLAEGIGIAMLLAAALALASAAVAAFTVRPSGVHSSPK